MSSYYISRKNFSVWISLIFATLSLLAGAKYFFMLSSAGGSDLVRMTGAAVLPFAAAAFLIATFLFGKNYFKMTVFPVFFGVLSLMILSAEIVSGGTILVCGLIYLLVMMNIIKTSVLLVYILGISSLFHLYGIVGEYFADGQFGLKSMIFFSSVSSLLFATIAMRRDYGNFTLRWNDRAYGRRVRSMPPMSQITPYFMPDRIGAQNLIRDSLDLTVVEEYIAKKRKEGLKGFGFMHVFIAAYLRVIAAYPGANRFLAGQKVYSRFNCIISFVVKKAMTTEAPDTVVKMGFQPGVSANEVYDKISKLVDENKGEDGDSTFDTVAKIFSYLPGVFLKFVVWFLKLLDYFGLLPTALEDVSPFHGSMFFTSMASLGIPVIHHHLYDFGNVPVFCAFGKKYKVNEIGKDGSVETKRYIDYSVSVDERICDGFYFAMVLKEFKRVLSNPECLDQTVEPKEDIK